MLTQARLKELFHYNPETVIFTRLIKTSNNAKVGEMTSLKRSHGYIVFSVDNVLYRAHRLVWLYVYGELPKEQIDHINHIRDDNRISNLRLATNRENSLNKPLTNRNKSKVFGVTWHKAANKWQVHITVDDKSNNIYLGIFSDKFEAICARKSAELKYGYHPNHGR